MYMGSPPYADFSHVHTAVGGSAPVRRGDGAYFHFGKSWSQGDVQLLGNSNFLIFF